MSLYASREGALYQSYDNYAGAEGFYEPQDGQQDGQQVAIPTPDLPCHLALKHPPGLTRCWSASAGQWGRVPGLGGLVLGMQTQFPRG